MTARRIDSDCWAFFYLKYYINHYRKRFLMRILDQLNQDMKEAMRAKDKERLTTIRMIKASIQNEEIDKARDLTSEEELTILSREKKQRLDSLDEFKKAGRQDLVEKIESELTIVDRYLPEQLSDEELEAVIEETISEVGAESMKDMGTVMGAVMPKIQGRADGSQVNALVREKLSN